MGFPRSVLTRKPRPRPREAVDRKGGSADTASAPSFQNEKLSRNETRLDGDASLRLARELRNATQHTGQLFGDDLRTAYQLLARVLQHESRQQGFELAAMRDAGFHEVGGGGSALGDGPPPGGTSPLGGGGAWARAEAGDATGRCWARAGPAVGRQRWLGVWRDLCGSRDLVPLLHTDTAPGTQCSHRPALQGGEPSHSPRSPCPCPHAPAQIPPVTPGS